MTSLPTTCPSTLSSMRYEVNVRIIGPGLTVDPHVRRTEVVDAEVIRLMGDDASFYDAAGNLVKSFSHIYVYELCALRG